jgi:DNA-binding SARP family transcriptional activator
MPAAYGRCADLEQPAVRVFTLGRFQVEISGVPLQFARKAQRRPLDLLELLIAYGGEGVATDRVADALWPDAEGDAAYTALRATLSRLRKLIGANAVLGANRSLTLNSKVCWIDALAMSEQLSRAGRPQLDDCDGQTLFSIEEALSHYAGDFLPGEDDLAPVISARERLRSLYLRHLVELGRLYEQDGQSDRAMDLYRRGLEVDAAAEVVLRAFMRSCRNLGRSGEGIAAYRSCQAAMLSRLGVAPSAATQLAYRELLRHTEPEATGQPRSAGALPAAARDIGPAEIAVAVLPFVDQSPGRAYQPLADAVRETSISLLGAFPQLSLITVPQSDAGWRDARSSEVSGDHSAPRYLLQCNVLVSTDHLRATANLVDARSGRHAWSEQMDHTLGDSIKTCDEVAIRVAEGLVAKLLGEECAGHLLNPNVHVWKALALARVLLNRQSRQDHLRACALIARVMEAKEEEEEPFSLALRANSRILEGWKWWTARPEAMLRSGEQEMRELQKHYGWGAKGIHAVSFACALRGDFDEAMRVARRRIDQAPDDSFTHAFLGLSLLYQGRHAEAMEGLTDAVLVSPQPVHWVYKDRAAAQFCAGRYDEAASTLATVLVDDYPLHRESNLLNARMLYVASLAAGGRVDQARHEAHATLAAYPLAAARDWCRWHFQPYRVKSPASRIERLLVGAGLPRQRAA